MGPLDLIEVKEVLRRREAGQDRKTVRRYVEAAADGGSGEASVQHVVHEVHDFEDTVALLLQKSDKTTVWASPRKVDSADPRSPVQLRLRRGIRLIEFGVRREGLDTDVPVALAAE